MRNERPKRVMVQARLNEALVKEVDHLAVELRKHRRDVMELLMAEALQARKENGGG